MSIDPLPASIGQIRSGKLRALAVTTAPALGGAAGCADRCRVRAGLRGPADGTAMLAPRNTSGEIVETLNRGNQCGPFPIPGSRARLAELGAITLGGSPADFAKLIAEGNREVGQGGFARTNVRPE